MAGSKDFDNTVIKNRPGGPQLQCGKGLGYNMLVVVVAER